MINADISTIEQQLRNTPDQYLDFLAKKPLIEKIIELRDKKDVLILGHNYMSPLVYNLSDYKGDSLALSMHAAKTDKPIILFDGVRFMAQTAKILNPTKKVLIADDSAGCSLADNFGAQDALEYKIIYPDAPVVTYINSYAELKAVSDYCCTSSNALKVIETAAIESRTNKVIFLPDSLMGKNLEKELQDKGSEIQLIYPGKHDKKYTRCEVHEKFTRKDIQNIRQQYNLPKGSKDTAVLVHFECQPEVIEESDFHGSTSGMARYIREHNNLKRVYLATECEMTANLANEFPQVEFVRSCQVFCQHMAKITLEKILYSLQNEVYEVLVPEDTRNKALLSVQRMLEIK